MVDECETMICEVWDMNGSNVITIKKRFSEAIGIKPGDHVKVMIRKVE